MKKKQQLDSIKPGDIADKLTTLNNDIARLKAKIDKDTGPNDARRIGLSGLQQIIVPAAIWFNSLIALFNRIKKDEFPAIVLLPDLPLAELLYMMEGFSRWGVQILCNFKIESLLYNILVSLSPAKIGIRGFQNILDALFESITIDDDKKQILKAFAAIRNTFHSNGIHNNESFSVVIDETMFEFKKGEDIECASFKNTCIIMGACIKVLSKILYCPEIRAHTEIMQDEYVEKVDIVSREEFRAN